VRAGGNAHTRNLRKKDDLAEGRKKRQERALGNEKCAKTDKKQEENGKWNQN